MACFPALAEALGAVKKALAEPQGAVAKAPAEPQGDVTIYGATFNFSARNEIKKKPSLLYRIEECAHQLMLRNDVVCAQEADGVEEILIRVAKEKHSNTASALKA